MSVLKNILKGSASAWALSTFVKKSGPLGTPSSGTLTNCTGLPISSGVSGLAANIATFLTTPSSANLASALTDEYGSGLAQFGSAWTTFSPGFTGFSSNPTVAARWCQIGKTVFVAIYATAGGTSNATTFTITGLPVTSANQTSYYYGYANGVNSGAGVVAGYYIAPNSTVITLLNGVNPSGWTNSGTKFASLFAVYEAA